MNKEKLKAYEEQLKPCPFCGGKAELKILGESIWAGCFNSHCNVYLATKTHTNVKSAIRDWNKRGKAE